MPKRGKGSEGAPAPDPVWRKSTATGSGGAGNCLEAAIQRGALLVRDSKDQSGPTLAFSFDAWTALLGELKRRHRRESSTS